MNGIILIGLGVLGIILWGIGIVTLLLAMKSEQKKTISLGFATLVALTPVGWVAFAALGIAVILGMIVVLTLPPQFPFMDE